MMVLVGIVAWASLTCLPIVTAIACWKLARNLRHGWIVHVAFLPALFALTWLLDQILFWAAGDDGDGPPGLGLALIPALLILVVTVPAYYGALVTETMNALARRRKSADRMPGEVP